MRRLAAIGLCIAAAVGVAVAGPGARKSEAGNTVAVDALFHNAAGVVSGQNVKIAGVPAGTVESVVLTEDRLALVHMQVESPFAPFRADARCEVRPQSLIGERFVQCDPGTPEAGPLEGVGDQTPTVPVNRTSSPIDLDLVFDALRRPYRERLAIVLGELGAGLDGRGEDIDATIRSANPALADGRRLLATVNRQRDEIQAAISDTDRILASVAAEPENVGRFLRKAADVSERVGRQDTELGATVERLPELLGEAEPALRELDGLAVEALPVAESLHNAAPGARRLANELVPLSRAARPTVRRLGAAAARGRTAISKSQAFASSLRRTLQGVEPLAPTTRELVGSLVAAGGTEGLLRFFYNAALATSRFDSTSHIFPAHLVGGLCSLYRTVDPPVEGCNGRFAGSWGPGSADGRKVKGRLKIPQLGQVPEGSEMAPIQPGQIPAPGTPGAPELPPIELPPAAPPSQSGGDSLLDFLLGP